MSRLVRCRRCGAQFLPDSLATFIRSRRLCPRCRGPLPPTGGVPATDGGTVLPCLPEAAP